MHLPLTAVLLASGFGRRYGGNKLEEGFEGKPLYRCTLDHVTEAVGKEHVVVVTQYRSILEEMEREGIRALHNAEAAEGISASIRIGTREALERTDSEAVIFFAADMPYLPADEIRRFAHQFLWSGKPYGCMEFGPEHTMTNPGAFRLYRIQGKRTVDENPEQLLKKTEGGMCPQRNGRDITEGAGQLLALTGDLGAMRIMKQHPQDIYRYQVSEDAVTDIDVPLRS